MLQEHAPGVAVPGASKESIALLQIHTFTLICYCLLRNLWFGFYH